MTRSWLILALILALMTAAIVAAYLIPPPHMP